jgi:3-oxoacyl-[acyl-carrier protein] reductase
MSDLQNRCAIVTGAGRGIGCSIALCLAKDGANVIVNDLDLNSAEEIAEVIRSFKGAALACVGDVSNPQDAMRIVQTAVDAYGGLDVLVNNAGNLKDALIHEMDDLTWRSVLDVHLTGSFNMIRASSVWMRDVAKRELEAGDTHYRKIVNLTSVVAETGNPGQANYSAAKGGIISLTKTIAREWAQFRINVNCVAPGFIRTRMTEKRKGNTGAGIPSEVFEKVLRKIPLGRQGEPEEVAKAVRFLCSSDSDYLTGIVLGVNGGLHM